jgi:CubicO group peptidase (beta-lactamase class C family)
MYPNTKNNNNSRSWKRLAGSLLPAVLLFTSLTTVSCSTGTPQELTTNEKLWETQALKDYDFTLERQAFAPEDWRGPVNIQVRNGEAVAVTYVSTGEAVTGGKFDNADTIDKLFTVLEDAYGGNNEFQHRADTIDVTYNSQMGYPEDLYIDVSQKIADEERGYSVSNFVARSASGTAVLQDRIVATALSQQGPQDPVEMEAFLDDLLQREMEEQHIAGAAVAIVKDGGLFFAKGYGYANLEKSIPVDPEKTNFRIGSVTKLFTWTAVMQLVEQGELDLNADINNYLDFRIPDTYPQPITLKNLMTHTDGFEERFFEDLLRKAEDSAPVREWLASHMPARIRPPGEVAAYSNYGADLAGYIVARVSGQPFEEYVQKHILDPLGMAHTTAALDAAPAELLANQSVGYTFKDGAFNAFPYYTAQLATVPRGAMLASAKDMARFMIAHLQGGQYSDMNVQDARILQQATVNEMQTTLFTHDPRMLGTDYGFFEFSDNGQRTIGHSGEATPFNTLLLLLPDQNLGIFVSYNSEGGANPTIQHLGFQRAFFDHYYPAPAVQPVQPPADFAKRAARFVGSYKLTRSSYTTLEKVKNLMGYLQIDNPGDGTLLFASPWFETRFVEVDPLYFRQVDAPFHILFREDSHGRVTQMFTDYTPMFAFEKVKWYETLHFNMVLAVGCLLVFLSIIPVVLVRLIRSRRLGRDRKVTPRGARIAQWVIAATCAASLAFVLGTVLWGDAALVPLFGVSPAFRIVLGIGVVAAVLTAGAVIYAVLAWKNGYWNTAARIYYTVVTVGAVAFIWFLNSWNLLGWRF